MTNLFALKDVMKHFRDLIIQNLLSFFNSVRTLKGKKEKKKESMPLQYYEKIATSFFTRRLYHENLSKKVIVQFFPRILRGLSFKVQDLQDLNKELMSYEMKLRLHSREVMNS